MNVSKMNQAFVLALVVAGFVTLTIKGEDTSGYVALVGPVIGAVFVLNRVDARSDSQDQVLAKISEQTNGVLTSRIQTAVAAALDARDQATGVRPPGDNSGLSVAPVPAAPPGDNLGLSSNGRNTPAPPSASGGA